MSSEFCTIKKISTRHFHQIQENWAGRNFITASRANSMLIQRTQNAEMNLKSTITKKFNFRIINSFMEYWRLLKELVKNKRVNGWMIEWMNKRMNDWTNKRRNEWINEDKGRASERFGSVPWYPSHHFSLMQLHPGNALYSEVTWQRQGYVIGSFLSYLEHDSSVVNTNQWDDLRSGRHDFGHYQHEHSHGQQIGYHQCNALTRIRREKERQQSQG